MNVTRNNLRALTVVAALAAVAFTPQAGLAQSCDSGDASLVGHWSFDEGAGTSAADSSLFANNGSLVNGAGWTGGYSGLDGDSAVALDGLNDYVSGGSGPSLDDLATLTYSAWIYPTADGEREIFSKFNSTRELRLKGTGTLRGCVMAKVASACSNSTPAAVPLNVWTHVAMTYDDSGDRKVHLFINGVEVFYDSQSVAAGDLSADGTAPQLFGRRQNGSRHFNGFLDEARIYSAVLDLCRIQELAVTPECLIDDHCDNDLFCDGAEACSEGACVAGTPPACDDGAFCNGLETCNEDTDMCDPGVPPVCNDDVYCNGLETCNEVEDDCDPGIPIDCQDGNFCNGAEVCDESTESCAAGTPVVCDDGVDCTVDFCNGASDECDTTSVDCACDDANVCTTDSCGEAGCEFVDNTSACVDGNDCTADSCDPVGGCFFPNLDNGTACDDDDPETENDMCLEGLCQGDVICPPESCVLSDAKLTASDGVPGDDFGFSTAISGSTIVVGSRFGNAAYVFEFDGSDWTETAILTASDGAANDEFAFDVSISGDTIVVGAPQHNQLGSADSGGAYIYVKPAGGWENMTETHKVTQDVKAAKDQFGWSVSLVGDTLLVGAPHRDAVGPGAAYVFEFDGASWSQEAKLTASDMTDVDEFGISVEAAPTTMVVGAHKGATNGTNSGSAYVFEKPGAGWSDNTQTAKLLPNDGGSSDFFGQAVAISGDTVVVGARKDDDMAFDAGAVYVFDKPGGGWVDMPQTDKLTASDGAMQDEFGRAPAILGDTLIVGAPRASSARGSAYRFERTGGVWTEVSDLLASDASAGDEYGFVTALSEFFVVVGERLGDAVYVFNE